PSAWREAPRGRWVPPPWPSSRRFRETEPTPLRETNPKAVWVYNPASMTSFVAVVLAAGHGTRMKSAVPKVLHPLAGRPLLEYPLRAAFEAGAERAVVVTQGQPEIDARLTRELGAERIRTVVQDPPRGTGDAARIGLSGVTSARVLILYGDTPLVRASDLKELVAALDASDAPELVCMTCRVPEPYGYGRIVRDAAGRLLEIREQRDLRDDAERAISEVNAGMYAARAEALARILGELRPETAQGEYFLTDAVRLLGPARVASVLGHADALVGVNARAQLHAAEERLFARIRERHGRAGVTVRGH